MADDEDEDEGIDPQVAARLNKTRAKRVAANTKAVVKATKAEIKAAAKAERRKK